MRRLEDDFAGAAPMHPHVLGEVRVDQDRIELQPLPIGRMHELEVEAVGVGRPFIGTSLVSRASSDI